MAYHAGDSWLPGGWLGVDVFFVLSGFLITSLLLSEKERTGRISLRSFWGRRARRLLPAMALLLSAVMAWATFVSPATSRASLRGDAFSTLGYVANWRFILSGQGYFDHFGPQSPLLHTWSVAVEEQFYLLWPLLLLLVIRWRRRGVFTLAFLGAAASGVLMLLLSLHGTSPDRLYYGTDTRALPLLLGCALAAVRPSEGFSESISRMTSVAGKRSSRFALQVLGLAGAGGLAYCWFRVPDRSVWLYRGGFAVVAVSAAALLLSCADAPRGPLARVLSFRPLRYIGAISYGLYLAHWPIFLYLTHARIHQSGAALLGIRFAATFAVAVLSYHLIERPIRRGAFSVSWFRQRIPRLPRMVSRTFLQTTCLLLVGGLITGLTFTTRTTTRQLAAVGATPESAPSTQPPDPKPPALNSAQLAVLNRPLRVLVEGDSLAQTLAVGLGDAGAKYNYQSYNLGKLGCGVATGGPIRDARGEIAASADCDSWPAFRASDVSRYDPDVAVLLTGRWEILDRVYNGQWVHVGEPDFDKYLASRLDQAINVLSAGGAKVLVLTTPCFAPQEQADGSIFPFDDPARLARYNQLLREAVARNPGKASLGDLYGVLCPGNAYTSTVKGVLARMTDGVHITEAGGQYAASQLAGQIVALGSVRRAAQARDTHANEAQRPPS
jgi:peptidoglycan/LPS O-acetylase OafA/YrhL